MISDTTPGKRLVRHVRIGFIQQGSTLNAWCTQHGISVSGARQALIGTWDGPKGQQLRARLLEASGVAPAASARGRAA
jgi:hypothetical protein